MLSLFKNKAAIAGFVVGLCFAQSTLADTMNFDSLVAGTSANSDPVAMALGITFHNAAFLPNKDSDGIDIPGTEHWQIDPTVPDLVTAENASLQGWGVAPSGDNALDARWSFILMDFASASDIVSFSAILPNSTYGNLGTSDILFLNAAGGTLYDLAYSQGSPLATLNLPTTLQGVKDIVLASGTLYDNISITAVPVPGAVWLFGTALAGLIGLRRHKA